MAKILVIDNNAAIRLVISKTLQLQGHEVQSIASFELLSETMKESNFDIVIVDVETKLQNSNSVVTEISSIDEVVDIITVTDESCLSKAIETIKEGAFEYLVKPFQKEHIIEIVNSCIIQRKTKLENFAEGKQTQKVYNRNRFLGSSAIVCQLNLLIEKMAKTQSTPIFISGESGSGKSLAARMLHDKSSRASAPFISINCSALPQPLMDSELFGCEAGAYLDARTDQKGLVELADGGTLYVEEVADLSLSAQSHLLELIDSQGIHRVGGSEFRKLNIRLIIGTSRNLKTLSKTNLFNKELYYRLSVTELTLPPLREHLEDIDSIASAILRDRSIKLGRDVYGFSPTVINFFQKYMWPGNVSELINIIERMIVFTEDGIIHFDENTLRMMTFEVLTIDSKSNSSFKLPDMNTNEQVSRDSTIVDENARTLRTEIVPLEELEKFAILNALEVCEYNLAEASDKLGITRSALKRKMMAHEIESRDENETVVEEVTNEVGVESIFPLGKGVVNQ